VYQPEDCYFSADWASLQWRRMKPRLEERQTPDELSFRVMQQYTSAERLLYSLWSLVLVAVFVDRDARQPIGYLIIGLIIVYSAGYSLIRVKRGTNVTLTITHTEIISRGYAEDKYVPLRRRRKENDLAWRQRISDPEDASPTHPQGIYCGKDCVLPLVNEEDGNRIVELIYRRFPGTGSSSAGDNYEKPSGLTLLHLDQ
jgi:hypothetical protein